MRERIMNTAGIIKKYFSVKGILQISLIVLALAAFCWGIGRGLESYYQSEAAELYTMFFENSADGVDERIGNIENCLDLIMIEPAVIHFFNEGSVHMIGDICSVVRTYDVKEYGIKKIYLYNSQNGCIADETNVYPNFEAFWEACLAPMGISRESGTAFLNQEEKQRGYSMLKNDDHISAGYVGLAQSMQTGQEEHQGGWIGIILDEKEVLIPSYYRDLRSSQIESYVLDENKRIIMASGGKYMDFVQNNIDFFYEQYGLNEQRPDGKGWKQPVLTSSVFLKHRNWSMVFVVPQKALLGRHDSVNLWISLICILLLGTGVIIVFRNAGKNRALKEIALELKSYGIEDIQERGGAEMIELKKGVRAVLQENQAYKKKLEEQEQDIRYKVFDKIINGSYLTDGEIEKELKKADIILPKGKIVLLLVYISELYSDEKNFSDVKKEIIDTLYQITDQYTYIHDMDARKIAVFCFAQSGEESRSAIASMVSKIRTQIEPQVLAKLAYGVGSLAKSPARVHVSYQDGMEVLRYNMAGYTRECLWYEDLNKDEDTYYYSLATETQLYDYAVLGNSVEVSNLIRQIYYDNFVKRTISYRAAKGLMGELQSTVMKICKYIKESYPDLELNTEVPQTAVVAEFFEAVHAILERVCISVNENNKSKAKKTSERIVEYIDQNFDNSSLSLTDVALQFNLSEKYVSSAFKEYTGEKFSVYIETKRIEAACRLISDGSQNINEIASAVGYTNDITFRRAFKRRKNVTPTMYAEMVRKEI